jgi:hypothetical protein
MVDKILFGKPEGKTSWETGEHLGRDAEYSPSSGAEVENELRAILLPSAFVACSGTALAFSFS